MTESSNIPNIVREDRSSQQCSLRFYQTLHLPAAASRLKLRHLAEFNELCDFFAAFQDFKRMLFLNLAGFDAGMVAAAAHLLDKACTLDALTEPADKIYRGFAVVFLDLCFNCHVGEIIPGRLIFGNIYLLYA